MEASKFKVSEIFYSPQGEGRYTGQLTAWVRFFSCNLQCAGFSQKDPTDPSTYVLPHKEYDLTHIKRIEDLPVFPYGCDTSYSWSAKYKHLCPSLTAAEIGEQLLAKLPNNSFYNTNAVNDIHLAFTGGEPLLPKGQKMIIEVLRYFYEKGIHYRTSGNSTFNYPLNVTIETNGTQELTDEFIDAIHNEFTDTRFFFSISPKLFHVSGEWHEKTFNLDAVKKFGGIMGRDNWGQLKFVVNNTKAAWDELEETIAKWKAAGVYLPIWIMPLGATIEQQESSDMVEIVEEAMKRGYNISNRVHVHIWGNKVGT